MPGLEMSSSCVPMSETCPFSSTSMRSACMSVVILCEMRMTVARPRLSRRAARIFASVSESTAESESSKTMTGAPDMSILAMATRCFCPPERVTPRSPTSVS